METEERRPSTEMEERLAANKSEKPQAILLVFYEASLIEKP